MHRANAGRAHIQTGHRRETRICTVDREQARCTCARTEYRPPTRDIRYHCAAIGHRHHTTPRTPNDKRNAACRIEVPAGAWAVDQNSARGVHLIAENRAAVGLDASDRNGNHLCAARQISDHEGLPQRSARKKRGTTG